MFQKEACHTNIYHVFEDEIVFVTFPFKHLIRAMPAVLTYIHVQHSIPNILFGRFEPSTSGGAFPAQEAGG
jgi:hypothetical protein